MDQVCSLLKSPARSRVAILKEPENVNPESASTILKLQSVRASTRVIARDSVDDEVKTPLPDIDIELMPAPSRISLH
jgi:hypothetical protein